LDAIQPLNNVMLNVDIWSLDIKATPSMKVEIKKKKLSPKLKKLNCGA
jgi:outer membrane protein W